MAHRRRAIGNDASGLLPAGGVVGRQSASLDRVRSVTRQRGGAHRLGCPASASRAQVTEEQAAGGVQVRGVEELPHRADELLAADDVVLVGVHDVEGLRESSAMTAEPLAFEPAKRCRPFSTSCRWTQSALNPPSRRTPVLHRWFIQQEGLDTATHGLLD